MEQVIRDTKGYIAEAYEDLRKMGKESHRTGQECYDFILNYNVPARIDEHFLEVIADNIRIHEWKTEFIAYYVRKNSKLTDKQLIHGLCKNGGYHLFCGVLYRAGNV